jgi:hypothetical protein
MDFIGAMATATKALEGLKLLKGLEKAFDEASFKLQIRDITSKLGRSQDSPGRGQIRSRREGCGNIPPQKRVRFQSRKHN